MQALIDISALSSCFKEYGPHPLHYVFKLMQPVTPSAYNLLGNTVNNMFDAVVSVSQEKWTDELFKETLKESWQNDALHYLDVDEEALRKVYFNAIQNQYKNVCKTIGQAFPAHDINAAEAWLEPSFICPELGLSGRMDLLDLSNDSAKIVELKSGKMNEWQGKAKQAHRVQTMLYAEVLHRCKGIKREQIHSFLHYNCYPLLEHQIFPEELYQSAISLRDEIKSILHEIASGKGRKYFTRKAIEEMYPDEYSKLWLNYDKPQLLSFIAPIEEASPATRNWFFDRLQFILHEEELKALQPEETRLHGLSITELRTNEKQDILGLVLSFDADKNSEHDFRTGDPVILYPLATSTSSRSEGIILRGCIEGLSDSTINLSLRHTERSCHFEEIIAKQQTFAIEHDVVNSNLSQACRSLYNILLNGGPDLSDCQLIVGPPGTGKTSVTLRKMVHDLYYETEERVLLLAFTHRAVDEICETLEAECPFVRLGTTADTPEPFRPHLLQTIINESENRSTLKQKLQEQRFWVGTTARLLSMPQLFDLVEFDTIIVDEASQLLDFQVLSLLKKARKKSVLIGDPKQLPAVTLQDSAQSLFEQLYRRYKEDGKDNQIKLLDHQGRMHPSIAEFANRMFYGGQLKPIGLPHQQEESSIMPRYAFIDVPCQPLGTKTNPAEANMVARLVHRIAEIYQQQNIEWTEKTLGIIVPYRQQIAAIRKELENLKQQTSILFPAASSINIDTVERYQGSQRDIIIYSTTVSTEEQLSLLSAPIELDGQLIDRKLNVAITRARKHLFIIGNKQLLQQSPIYRELLSSFTDKK